VTLDAGFHAVAPGWLATIVTHLEMREPPAHFAPPALQDGLTIRHVPQPDPDWYRRLFRRIGTDWLWSSRLDMPQATLAGILHDPRVSVWSLVSAGQDLGLLELDFRTEGGCKLEFFGLDASLQGQGVGHALMGFAIQQAWARPIRRLHFHTCTHDHPSALPFYRGHGFVPYRQQVEVLRDPRLTGVLPLDAAAHIPLYRPVE
jgi:GNAT superfamily N-acetyltransferase